MTGQKTFRGQTFSSYAYQECVGAFRTTRLQHATQLQSTREGARPELDKVMKAGELIEVTENG